MSAPLYPPGMTFATPAKSVHYRLQTAVFPSTPSQPLPQAPVPQAYSRVPQAPGVYAGFPSGWSQPPYYNTHPPIPPPPGPAPVAVYSATASPAPKAVHRSTAKENAQPSPNTKTPKRKRTATDNTSALSKRTRSAYERAEAAAGNPPPEGCGVGPSTSGTSNQSDSLAILANISDTTLESQPTSMPPTVSLPPPHQHRNPTIERAASQARRGRHISSTKERGSRAVDIWPFIYGLDSKEQHDVATRQGLTGHPKTAYLGCKLCMYVAKYALHSLIMTTKTLYSDAGKWKVYPNNNSGLTSNIRRHLQEKHGDDWYKFCKASGYLREDTSSGQGQLGDGDSVNEPFSIEKFQDLLVDWIAVDDQVSKSTFWCRGHGVVQN